MERLHSTIYGIALRQKQIMASIASSPLPAASTPAPRRGELWRRRRDGLYAVVIGINGPNGSVISISSFGEGMFWGVDQFIGLFTKVGEFDGSKWRDENGQWRGILTVSLTPSNTVKIVRGSTGEIIMDSYSVREFLDKVTFQSAGPASAGAGGPARSRPTAGSSAVSSSSSTPAPERGQLWISAFGDYCVILEVGKKRWHGEDVVKYINKHAGFTDRLSVFSRHEYVGELKDSRWTYDGKTVTVSLANDDEDVMMVDENGNEWPVPIQSFFANATEMLPRPRGKKRKRPAEGRKKRNMPPALLSAIENGDIEAIKKMIKDDKLDINEEFDEGYETTILLTAIYSHNVKFVEFLLENGAKVNIKINDGVDETLLERAIMSSLENDSSEVDSATEKNKEEDKEREQIIDLLLKFGANVKESLEELRETDRARPYSERPYPLLVKLLKYSERWQSTCPICLDALGGFTPFILKLSCGHMFHRNCIQEAAKRSGSRTFSCPSCRTTIKKTELSGDGEVFVNSGKDDVGNVVYKLTIRQDLKF